MREMEGNGSKPRSLIHFVSLTDNQQGISYLLKEAETEKAGKEKPKKSPSLYPNYSDPTHLISVSGLQSLQTVEV